MGKLRMDSKWVLVILLLVLSFGCATPLTVEKSGEIYAEIAGVEKRNINFISYCNFALTEKPERRAQFYEGVFLLTTEGVVIVGQWGGMKNLLSGKLITAILKQLPLFLLA